VLGDADNVVAELLGIGLGHSWHPSRPPGRASQIRCHLLVHQPPQESATSNCSEWIGQGSLAAVPRSA
ncbi:hypothetical protein, partial [Gordonia sputi]|uniref:hypothetical protein n=1 Tax=Gordonia sputi TaxID=36823 RepID=UPI001B348AE3